MHTTNSLDNYIRTIVDFPKKGIQFKDITPLLNDSNATKLCLDALIDCVGDQKVDKVVGIESRGFFFGTLLAQHFNAGFVPVRKPNKLPYETITESYDLEYGTDQLEMHSDAILQGERVLIHDDVLATGGTAEAVCKMVERLGGHIIQCNFIMELGFLNGRSKISNYDIRSALVY